MRNALDLRITHHTSRITVFMTKPQNKEQSTPLTEAELFVRRSDEDVARFDPQRISDALVRETKLSPEMAHQISIEVKEPNVRSDSSAPRSKPVTNVSRLVPHIIDDQSHNDTLASNIRDFVN